MTSIIHQTVIKLDPKVKTTTDESVNKDKCRRESLDSRSSLGIKYPTLRDDPLHTGKLWLEGKRADDGAEGLWRIHDNLYDLSSFVNVHPGGKDWLRLTKGTDITEAFEAHHLSDIPETLLPEFFIRNATSTRNSPFTFKEDGFYKVLRKNVYAKLKTLPKHPADRSKFLTDLLFFSYVSLALISVYFRSYTIGALSGVVLALLAIAAHNFFHQRDNFRMYYFNFTMMGYREWRISHALSHHLYTNTINDLEISSLEPWLQYLPTKKNVFFRYASWLYSPVLYALMFNGFFVKTLIQVVKTGSGLTWELFIPFTIPVLMFVVTSESMLFCAQMFLWIITIGSLYFGVVGVNAAHHHPDIFHDGDTSRKDDLDWGIYQLDTVMDRKDITGSHFLVLTNFGDHAIHHLFPTIDHGHLEHLYPVFLDTCKQFGLEWKLSTQLELVKGQYRQLAKTRPKEVPPKALKKNK